MDGGGRFARSLTRLWPGSHDRAKARLSPQRRSSSRRHSGFPESQGRGLVGFVDGWRRRMPRYAGTTAACIIMLSGAGAGIVMGDHLGPVGVALADARDAVANAAGFRITKLNIAGRKQLEQDVVLGIGGITPRTSLLFLNAASVRDKLKASPWIADATVSKYYPDRLQIDITERQAFALWQQDGQLSVISEDGTVLETYIGRRFAALPLVVGDGAAPAAREFLGVLARYPQIQKEVRAIVMVGERRWNLRLNNGIDVRLPEKNPDRALALLAELDRDKQLMSRDITSIDMRLPDQVTVRLSDEAGKARDELMKDKKKPKAGAA